MDLKTVLVLVLQYFLVFWYDLMTIVSCAMPAMPSPWIEKGHAATGRCRPPPLGPGPSLRLHVVAVAAYQLEGRGVDLEKSTVDTRRPYGGHRWPNMAEIHAERSMRSRVKRRQLNTQSPTHLITSSLWDYWVSHSLFFFEISAPWIIFIFIFSIFSPYFLHFSSAIFQIFHDLPSSGSGDPGGSKLWALPPCRRTAGTLHHPQGEVCGWLVVWNMTFIFPSIDFF